MVVEAQTRGIQGRTCEGHLNPLRPESARDEVRAAVRLWTGWVPGACCTPKGRSVWGAGCTSQDGPHPASLPSREQITILTPVKVLGADQPFPSKSLSSQIQWCNGDHFLPGHPFSSRQTQGRAPVRVLGSCPTPDQRPEVSKEAAPLALRTQAPVG